MAGIYIHIPFCKTRCIYCDFFSQTDEGLKGKFVNAICKELEMRKDYLSKEIVQTIYFGGGTPSQLSKDDFEKIFRAIKENYILTATPEITLEANPDDLNTEYVNDLTQLPFNRISIGIQSFNDEDLQFLNRRHNAETATKAVKLCQNLGFNNISIDLMYGLPDQTLDKWKFNLHQSDLLNIQHISAYHLIYEEDTVLYDLLKKNKVKIIDDELSLNMFAYMREFLAERGFIHYEISNFSKGSLFSKHNTSYWKGEKYLGVGPSAHSYDGISRSWNIASLNKYIEGIKDSDPLFEIEKLSPNDNYNDYILTRLRTMWGINLNEIKETFGPKFTEYFLRNINRYMDNGDVKCDKNIFTLTPKGIFISDTVMSDLMLID